MNNRHPHITPLITHYQKIRALDYANRLAQRDQETMMPTQAGIARGAMHAQLASIEQDLYLDKQFQKDLQHAYENQDNYNDAEKAIIRTLHKKSQSYTKLPATFVQQRATLTTQAQTVRAQAKNTNDRASFTPMLTQIIELARQKTDIIGYNEHPYDAMLDEFEMGLTTAQISDYFSQIKQPLQQLITSITQNHSPDPSIQSLQKAPYDTNQAKADNTRALKLLGYPADHMRLDTAHHPFSESLHPRDLRITTRYRGIDIQESLTATIHEFGHGMYEYGMDQTLRQTPIGTGHSLTIHESQSRFRENIVGRSQWFSSQLATRRATQHPFNKPPIAYTAQAIYAYFNHISPGLIRVEADQITYHMHILIRFEIEKGLATGEYQVADLPNIRNSKYQEYLGITPPDDSRGVLQDIHRSIGCIGYFPTYSLGSALSYQILHHLQKDLGEIETVLSTQGPSTIMSRLQSHIHIHGSSYTANELTQKVFNEKLNPQYMLNYFQQKTH